MLKRQYVAGDSLDLKINSLSQGGGRGVARLEGFVVFVEGAAPEDELRVKLTKVKKRHAEAQILEILKASPYRVLPACSVFKECGGCQWQHINYSEQLRQKALFVERFMHRLGLDESIFKGVKPSAKDFRYRNRIQLKKRGKQFGFYKRKTHDFLPIEDCLIADERLLELAKKTTMDSNFSDERFEVALDQKSNAVLRSKTSNPQALLFSQVNESVNKYLKAYVESLLCKEKNFSVIYDLYAGSGNFSFLLQKIFPNSLITAVEYSKASVAQAQVRARALDETGKIKFLADDVKNFLSKKLNKKVDFMLLDPPRMGLSEKVRESLLLIRSQKLIYISCDLNAAQRDLKDLMEAYSVKEIKAFDMFPQTDHLETVFYLEAKNIN